MTPAERAREIDRQEFEAESKAVLKRALAYSQRKRKEERARVMGVAIEVTGDFNQTPPPSFGRKPKLYTYGTETRTAAEWALHLGLKLGTFTARMRKNGLAGAINYQPPWQRKKQQASLKSNRGASADLPASWETGGRGTAQETPNIGFQGNDA